ncbi:unnamed protein product [Pleuronectes platessa]|uniref:Uncharacterized protein n=1 Tax=Pleuronectes platessa TaxID=8262 RepID=A0A9N7ZA01_PLEPL|nr:unnamed protein product [Pleuronectes platessa]
MKFKLKCSGFDMVEEIQLTSQMVPVGFLDWDLQRLFRVWQENWKRCIAAQGDYLKGLVARFNVETELKWGREGSDMQRTTAGWNRIRVCCWPRPMGGTPYQFQYFSSVNLLDYHCEPRAKSEQHICPHRSTARSSTR